MARIHHQMPTIMLTRIPIATSRVVIASLLPTSTAAIMAGLWDVGLHWVFGDDNVERKCCPLGVFQQAA